MLTLCKESQNFYETQLHLEGISLPDFHIVLGSGFGEALKDLPPHWIFLKELNFNQIPGFVSSTVADHKGAYHLYRHEKTKQVVQIQLGRIHGYEGYHPKVVTQPVMLPRLCGVKKFILTNAAGGLLKNQNPGGAMIITDHVNLTGQNPLIGHNPTDFQGQDLGPRFPDMGQCYQPQWNQLLKKELLNNQVSVTEGIYLGLLGPSFETHAEVQLFASWGMGAVGMSTVWETIALKHSQAQIAGISLISNLGAGIGNTPLDHETIVETCRLSASSILKSILSFVEKLES
jgi:purine-nucleoside phosphorylase